MDLYIEVIPGVPALAAGAALLGAPLMHDFVVIYLSDLLTPWETILKRLELAAQGDLVIVLYNPKSKKRTDKGVVRDLLLRSKAPGNPGGHRLPGHAGGAVHHRHHPGGFVVACGGHADHRGGGQLPDLHLRRLHDHAPGLSEQVPRPGVRGKTGIRDQGIGVWENSHGS